MPAVSVILPTCDRPQLVGRALRSLLQQSFADLEVILVDAHRRTAPAAANPALAPLLADARVRIVDGRAAGNAAMSRNLGLRAAAGEWITFLDDDDEYLPDKIAAQHALATATGAPFVLCGYEFVWPRRRRRRQVDAAEFRGDDILRRAFLGSPVLFHRRDDSVRFDETLAAGEDLPYVLSLLVRRNLRALPCVPRALVVVHPQPTGQSVHADKEAVWRAYRAGWFIARRHFSRPGRRALLAHGRLQRAMGGHGGLCHLLRCAVAVLRTRGLREWRLVVFAGLARLRVRAQPAPKRS